MKWTPGTQNDDVVDVRGSTGGGRGGAGTSVGIGSVVVLVGALVLSRVLGVDLSGLFSGGGGGGSPPASAPSAEDKELVDKIKDVMKDVQTTWDAKFQEVGKSYHHAKLYIFNEAIDTKCGRSTSAIGPFYCPGDENAYIDLSFYRDLRERFGAPGDFAQIYVLAHEIGHHVQNLLDAERELKRAQPRESNNQHSVRIELQADCYAGVWGHEAKGRDRLEAGDLEEAITAAQAIGDDRLQKQSGRNVNPESFTHGTSAQRVAWFRRGFDTGKIASCDTFSGDI
ncbi:MAG: neutral zinc metallopeptidase [Kofleriaceae bacterium]